MRRRGMMTTCHPQLQPSLVRAGVLLTLLTTVVGNDKLAGSWTIDTPLDSAYNYLFHAEHTETMTCSTLELTGGDEPIMCSYGDGTWLTGFATGLTQPAGVDAVFLECHYDSGGPPLDATPTNLTTVMSMPSRTEVKLTPNMNLLDYTLLPPAQQAALTSLPGTRLESSVLAAAAAATASPDNVVSMRYCQLMHGSCDVSAAPACAEFAGEWQSVVEGSASASTINGTMQCCRGVEVNGTTAKPNEMQCSYETDDVHGYIVAEVGAMGTFTSGEFYEVEARVEGGERYFDNGTCRVGTMAWSLPFAADALVGKRGVTVGLALLGNAAIVESKWTAIRIVNGSEASEPPCQLNAACRADLASQCVRYMSLQEKCVSVPSSYFLILAIVGLLAVACVAVTSYICYFKWYKPGAPGLNGRYIFC